MLIALGILHLTVTPIIAVLPLALFELMGTRYFGAIPFVGATIMVCVAALALLAAAFWPKPNRPLTSS